MKNFTKEQFATLAIFGIFAGVYLQWLRPDLTLPNAIVPLTILAVGFVLAPVLGRLLTGGGFES